MNHQTEIAMIFTFLILSDEVEDFRREISIDSDATFLDFYRVIVASTGFSDKEMASFFLCDEKWRKEKEITLVEMDTYSDEDSYIMEECVLGDFLEDENQKMMFVFDYLTERALYIELSEIITGKKQLQPRCTLSVGEAPSAAGAPCSARSNQPPASSEAVPKPMRSAARIIRRP